MLERFVRVKTSTEASRDHDAQLGLVSSPSSETDSHSLAFSYVPSVYVFEFVCILYVIIFVTPRFLTFDRFQNRSAHFKTGWPVLKREARAFSRALLKYPVEMQHGVISQQFRHFAGDSFTATSSQCISKDL